ncbi:uncharacterized protein LOC127002685 isoform X1 [Eriocheir sinensis]|uniref:uncharacterized protein LOC127002685 isoform X1 n=1 Tax=Eriocheir sinensis TaxID=95602 RepID=UPI0021C58063|nr:uncharacterized protein LOC127002685 isoform X1 [Eriocheir sinensis]XP_050724701.1 uncharacterized protein LOC127002685 isoform X1 [Eriocheir sinensis]
MSGELLWPKRAVISLCGLVQSHKSLWDPGHKDYARSKVRKKIYDELAEELKEMYPAMTFLTGDIIRQKFKKTKAYFMNEHKRIQTALAKGEGKTSCKWEYYNHLLFLFDVSVRGTSESPCRDASPSPERGEPPQEGTEMVVEHRVSSNDNAPYTDPLNIALQRELVFETPEENHCYLATTHMLPSSSSVQDSPAQPPRGSKAAELSYSRFKRRKTHYDQGTKSSQYDEGTGVAEMVTSHRTPQLSYAASIAGVVENLIKMCPAEQQQEFGFTILQVAHEKYADAKNKNDALSSTPPNITIQVGSVEGSGKF